MEYAHHDCTMMENETPTLIFSDPCVGLKREKKLEADKIEIVDRGIISFKLYYSKEAIVHLVGHNLQNKKMYLYAEPVYSARPTLHSEKRNVVVIRLIDQSSYKVIIDTDVFFYFIGISSF